MMTPSVVSWCPVGVSAVLNELEQRRKSLRCKEVRALLASLGFVVRDCAKGGHKSFTHPKLPDFFGSNFNCGHSDTHIVLPVYIQGIRRVIERHREDLAVIYGK